MLLPPPPLLLLLLDVLLREPVGLVEFEGVLLLNGDGAGVEVV
jgi:hypothetical protein